MTTAAELIQAAFREGNLLAAGVAATTAQTDEALGRLNNFLFALMGNELGEPLQDWPVYAPQRTAPVAANFPLYGSNVDGRLADASVWPYPPGNVRLMVSAPQAATVWLQYAPNDGARVAYVALGNAVADLTIEGNGRMIEGATSITVEAALVAGERVWFYRADRGSWILLEPLALASDSPLPTEFDDLLITGLSIRLASRFGNEPRSGTVMTYQEQMKKLKARYRQPTPTLGGSQQIPPGYQAFPQSAPGNLLG